MTGRVEVWGSKYILFFHLYQRRASPEVKMTEETMTEETKINY